MSVSTFISRNARRGRSHRFVAIVAIAAVLAAWGIAYLTGATGEQPRRINIGGESSVLQSLTPSERQYVTAIASLNPATLAAAFGTDPPSGAGATLAKLTPAQRRYVRSIAAMSYAQLGAAFGTNPPISGRAER